MGRIANAAEGYIDYRLNITGIRVWTNACQLIAKKGEAWQVIGAQRALPVRVPSAAQAGQPDMDELRTTAYQFQAATPQSDLAAVLGQSKSFAAALSEG